MPSESGGLVCMPCEESQDIIPGSVKMVCSECHRPVWVAPSGLLLLHDHQMPVLCVGCALKIKEAEVEVAALTPAQIDEIRECLEGEGHEI